MNTQAERQRLEKNTRKRTAAWRQLRERLLEYAQAYANNYTLAGLKIKGQGHEPRTRLNLANCFEKLLPSERITSRRGNAGAFTATIIYERFQKTMLAAGVEIGALTTPIVSEKHARLALTLFRLKGQPYDAVMVDERAFRVRAIARRRQQAWERLLRAEDEQFRKTQQPKEPCASTQ